MENKTSKILLFIFIGMVLIAGTFSGGLWIGYAISNQALLGFSVGAQSTAASPSQVTSSDQNLNDLFKPFWQAWEITHQEYFKQPLDDTVLMQGAIRGMLAALGDPHTSYMDPEEYKQATAPLQGEYEGIGAYVDVKGDYLSIVTPMPGSPAEAAGLKPGDQIIQVDGVDMTGVNPDIVLTKVKGPAGTPVTLSIQREGTPEPFDVTITRQKITLASVEGKMVDDNIAYLQLTTFGDKTSADLKTKLSELLANDPKGLILDLRYNGGGYLPTAVEVVSQFIKEGNALIEQYGDGTKNAYPIISGGLATSIPMVVLVNEGTASAAEITAGAIQDYKRGLLVGVQTYGKGSVQQWSNLDNSQGAVRVTVALWLTPLGRQINGVGLTPDYIVTVTQEDQTTNVDPQLEKAIDLLSMPQTTSSDQDQTQLTPKVIAMHTITDDETLTHLSLMYYGNTSEPYWRYIYEFNKSIIGDDYHNIYAGLVLEIPELTVNLQNK
jgi:carboxyl-terminal processing protease